MLKKIFLLFVFVTFFVDAQKSTMVINNYSGYYLEGRLGATDDNCTIFVYSLPSPGQNIYTVPPYTDTSYPKYSQSNLSTAPITLWLVNTNNNPMPRSYDHPVFYPTSGVTKYTDWDMFWFKTYDDQHNFYEDFFMGDNSCNIGSTTYQSGTYSDSEWFTISSGGTDYTFLQIY